MGWLFWGEGLFALAPTGLVPLLLMTLLKIDGGIHNNHRNAHGVNGQSVWGCMYFEGWEIYRTTSLLLHPWAGELAKAWGCGP